MPAQELDAALADQLAFGRRRFFEHRLLQIKEFLRVATGIRQATEGRRGTDSLDQSTAGEFIESGLVWARGEAVVILQCLATLRLGPAGVVQTWGLELALQVAELAGQQTGLGVVTTAVQTTGLQYQVIAMASMS